MIENRTVVFEDEHLTVELFDFNAHTGTAQILFREKHERVGFYYVWVNFASGNSTRIDYDGANFNRQQMWTVNTWQRDDSVNEIVVTRVRD